MKREVVFYRDAVTGREPAKEWIKSLDSLMKMRINNRIERIESGNLGDYRSLGAGLFEFRFHFGPGYRLYFGIDGQSLILLLMGGDKSTQLRDINKALENLKKHWEIKDGTRN